MDCKIILMLGWVMKGPLAMTKRVRIVVAVFCAIAAFALYKLEVIDHGWIVFQRDAKGFIGGWDTPENALTRDARWKSGKWDFDIVSKDSYRVRQHVNPVVGYLIPIALLGFAAFVTLLVERPKAKLEGTC